MTVTLELAPDIETCLRRKAAREGQDFTIFLQTVMEHEADEEPEESEGSAADLFAGRLGGIHSGGQGRAAGSSTSTEQSEKNKAALEAIRTWRERNATDDPKILEQRRLDWEELKQALNESHTSDRVLFP